MTAFYAEPVVMLRNALTVYSFSHCQFRNELRFEHKHGNNKHETVKLAYQT